MRRIARFIAFICVSLIFLSFALLSQPVLCSISERLCRRVYLLGTQIWARLLLRIIGVRVVLPNPNGPHRVPPELSNSHYLLVSNHQSYLDIVIIASVFPVVFVAKKEVEFWPLLGRMARLGGTIFIDREDAQSSMIGAYRASRVLRDGTSVQVFPESTTSDGSQVLPFKALFFASAIRAGAPILPLTINFRVVNGRAIDHHTRELLCWYGEMDFFPHFWNLLQIDSAEVSLMIHKPVKTSRMRSAKIIARAAQEKVISSFDSDKSSAIEAARAEVPVEFAAAREPMQTAEQTGDENDRATDFIVGALLYSLLTSEQNETN